MRLVVLAAGVVLSAGAMLASTTFATINYESTGKLIWGGPCVTPGVACPTDTVGFNYDGGLDTSPIVGQVNATMSYYWQAAGPAEQVTSGPVSFYDEPVEGYFTFTYGGMNLLTVDFNAAEAVLMYLQVDYNNVPIYQDLSLTLNPTTSGGVAPIFTSDILRFAPTLTNWNVYIDFGAINPGLQTSGGNQYIKNFNSSWTTFTVGSTPFPGGVVVPEPASMLMAGAGLLTLGGLLSLRKRFRK